MLLRRPKVYIILLTMMALWADGASAQGNHSGETFVAVRAGTNLVGNAFRVRETKPEPGAGVSIGRFLSKQWAVEFETWMRASNPECCGPRHTEMLYSVSVVRLLASEGIQPYMLGGLTLLQADHPELQVQIGVGAQFPLYRRLGMAVDLRGNGGGSTMIVRPSAALIYNFH
jgi:hypothetical protein